MAYSASYPVIIASGQSLSAGLDLGDQRLHRIGMPAGWTAAALSFQTSDDGVTYRDLYDGAGPISVAAAQVAAGRDMLVDPAAFYGVRWVKVRSGLPGAAVNQAAERSLTLLTVQR